MEKLNILQILNLITTIGVIEMGEMKLTSILSHGWAIQKDNSLIVKYWWFDGDRHLDAPWMDGYSSAMFKTRSLARTYLSTVKNTYPDAKVVKVLIDLKICLNKKQNRVK